MGNCCCHIKSPCENADERSNLLEDESKTPCTGEQVVGGACGPEGSADMRRTTDQEAENGLLKRSPVNGEMEPNNAQENGPLQKKGTQAKTPSPRKESELKENSARAQRDVVMPDTPNSGRAENQQCTLNLQDKDHSTADQEAVVALNTEPEEKEDSASVQDKVPDGVSLTTELVCQESPPHPQTNSTTEAAIVSISDDNDEEECSKDATNDAAKPSQEFTQNNEVLSVPKCQLAAAAGQEVSISAVRQETNTEALNGTPTLDLDDGSSSVCREDMSGDKKSQDVPQSFSGPEPTRPGDSGEEQESANSVKKPEATSPADAKDSLRPDQDSKPDTECSSTASSNEETSSEKFKQDAAEEAMLQVEDKDVPKAREGEGIKKVEEEKEGAPTETESPQAVKDAEIQEVTGEEEQLAGRENVNLVAGPADEEEAGLGSSEEDLYRGEEELSASPVLKVEDRCSLSPAVDILSYSEREWKGNTAKSALIRKGYKEMSQRFSSVRRVRGDNYCALRATLFQVLSQSTQLPAWLQEDDVVMLPKQLEAQEGLISQWRFPGECVPGDVAADAAQQLTGYVELLRRTWQAAADCASAAERQQLCEQVFQGGPEELGLLEALKLLMLGRAVELHGSMQEGGDVPLFCLLLFARDSSDCPRSFLCNHLRNVGLGAGLEQVEMFLLGYALQCTIQVYRLYKADTDEFVTYYPDDHKDDWQTVCLVTEDDRHYNVPLGEAAEPQEELTSL
ncbi:uncharacterized protein LOC133423188 [Cololabis saira]|uniref:uncharacterized protein LOC133423188 n=1 Tax=Cololabis saira TaxID=129043 RepID=UPI002AD2FA19|nr:uncharacterized protein LOC133423188 [Cololabis saira]